MENIVSLTGRARGALPKDLKESEANHEAEEYPHTGGTEGNNIGECFVLVLATIYIARFCTEKWC